ncbi:peptidylprolyl isomerase [Bosea sp. 117]|uniref:peptidylprolyl isomerase n=1 Tax=Bosea sp. 117 TaxID=1125973 RepID=UPI000A88525B|nr:peptidylprolyl isomerase [Bosea sp. 117]
MLRRLITALAVPAALLIALAVVPISLPAAAQGKKTDPQNTILLETTKGPVVIALRADIAPKHAERIKKLAREGFYNNVPFHRVIEGFMAQTGDGQYGNGTGGSKYPDLPAEFSKVPFKRGTVGMARASAPDSANSQFFICFDDASFLNGQYTVIGEVVSGMENVDKLKRGEPVANPDKIVTMKVAADAQ